MQQKDTMEHLNTLNIDTSRSYFAYVAWSYAVSPATPNLVTDYEPIRISAEIPGEIPENFIHIPATTTPNDPLVRTNDGDYPTFYRNILASASIQDLFRELIERQGTLPIKTFRNHPSFTPQFEVPGTFCFGLTPEESHRLNDKIKQVRLMEGTLPVAEHVICTAKDAPDHFQALGSDKGVFVSRPYGAGGSGTFQAPTQEELTELVSGFPDEEELFLAKFLPISSSPSIDVLIANPNEIIVYGILDQIYDPQRPLGCKGNSYPSELSPRVQSDIRELAYLGGRVLADTGFRGYVSFDFAVTDKNVAYFCEINARYAGSTAERLLMMELTRPASSPSIMDLELMALRDGTFHGHELWAEPKGLAFLRKEIYAKKDGIISLETLTPQDELELFRKKECSLVGAIEKGAQIKKGACIGKIVSVSDKPRTRDMIADALDTFVINLIE